MRNVLHKILKMPLSSFFLILLAMVGGALLLALILIAPLRWGPYSLEQVLTTKNLPPLYQPAPYTNYQDLGVAYYYKRSLAEVTLDAYFTTENQEGEIVRVALLSIYRYITVGGLAMTHKKVPIKLAYEGFGRVCEVSLSENRDDTFPGNPYQSCLYWYAEGDNGATDIYIFHTIWSEEETVDFANFLIPAEKEKANDP